MVNLWSFLLVFIGGGLGSLARYAVGLAFLGNFKSYFPFGTFAVNMIGCFLLGLILGFIQNKKWMDQELGLLLGTGFCGGFTTFSTFSAETNQLIFEGNWYLALGYIFGSVGLGLLMAFAGLRLAR